MLYVERDNHGNIVALSREPRTAAAEPVSLSDKGLVEFLGTIGSGNVAIELLRSSDTELARVTEDLVELLVDRGVILWTDLPEAARSKMSNRRRARASLGGDAAFMVNEEDIL